MLVNPKRFQWYEIKDYKTISETQNAENWPVLPKMVMSEYGIQ